MSDNIINEIKTTNDIKESTTIKTNEETAPITTKATLESNTNIESKSTSSVEEKTDKNIIEPSSISSIEHIEETDNTKDSIPIIIVNNNKDDNNKINTIAIVFSVLGGVILIGGIVGFIIYYKNKNVNESSEIINPSNSNINLKTK